MLEAVLSLPRHFWIESAGIYPPHVVSYEDSSLASVTADNKDVCLAVIAELSASMRLRSDAEHLYTAAALGAYGAICWGVASLQAAPHKYKVLTHPGYVAISLILIIAIFVRNKIIQSHLRYAKHAKQRGIIMTAMNKNEKFRDIFPTEMMMGNVGRGYKSSISIVVFPAIVSCYFCATLFI